MPTVRGGGRVTQGGYQTKEEIDKTHMPSKARDDLKQAFAGEENETAEKDPKSTRMHSTNVKSRKTRQSREKTPKR